MTRSAARPFGECAGALFDTPIGRCGVTWSSRGLTSVHLPEPTPAATRATVRAHSGGHPIIDITDAPQEVATAATRIAAMLAGRNDDLASVRLDLRGVSTFAAKVYRAARQVSPGHTASYGELARIAGLDPARSSRAVGRAVGANPLPIVVPCHRIIAADGRLGGYSPAGGTAAKVRLLLLERRGEAVASPPGYDVAAATAHLAAADPLLAKAIEDIGPCALRLRPLGTTVAALCEAIVSQQLSGRAAATIHSRLCVLFRRPVEGPTARGLLDISDDELRGAGLSRSKIAAVRDLAFRALAGEIPDLDELATMDDDAVIETLTSVRGIGRWTVEMLLIFRLGRPDILPIDDLGVRNGFARLADRASVTATELVERGERWHPHASVAAWYLWQVAGQG